MTKTLNDYGKLDNFINDMMQEIKFNVYIYIYKNLNLLYMLYGYTHTSHSMDRYYHISYKKINIFSFDQISENASLSKSHFLTSQYSLLFLDSLCINLCIVLININLILTFYILYIIYIYIYM